jgi:GH25 family lysozyme M1 (1,4-beta-N-acetylmuramidase)
MVFMIVAVGIAPETQRAMAQRPLGIDVSHYDGSINWGGVQTSGVSFAWAKATENTNFIDYTFTTNETSAVAAGVLIGAYHFARYNQNTGKAGADAEANYFWATAQNYVKRGGYYLMPMLDVEITPTNYTKTTLSQWVNEWCAKVVSLARANNVLVTPVIYSSSSFANTWFDSTVTQWIPWIANWNGQDPQIGAPSGTGPWPTWIVWQYTDSASVPGVGTADGDVFNGLASDLVTTLAIGGNGPLITNQPVSQAVLPGANVSFNVGASAPWPMSYQWRFNATNIAGATASSYAKNNVQLADGGSYSVVLSDLGGDTISSNAVLTLLGSPVITNQPQDQVAAVGQGAAFAVGVSSFAPVSYQWQFNGMPLQDATNASVVLAGIRSTNVGAYSVVVSNVAGVVVSSNAALVLVQDAALGDNTFGQGSAFAGSTNLIAVAAGNWFNLGLRADGTVVAWGDDSYGQGDAPAGLHDALAIAAGGYHSLALRANETVVAWGADDYGQTDVPNGLTGVIGVAAGTWHSIALRADGTVVAWGDNSFGQTNLPAGLAQVTAVAAGGNHTLALRADGTVMAWGENTGAEGNTTGQSLVPLGLSDVVAIAAGSYHSLALKADGTVVGWGDDSQGQLSVPPGLSNVVEVVGGGGHSVALRADGTIVAWGADWNRQCDVPPAMAPASGIAAGEAHTVVLLADSLPVPLLLNPACKSASFKAIIQTLGRRNYALDYRNSLTASNWTALSTNAGNGALRVLVDPTATAAQRFYRMRQW